MIGERPGTCRVVKGHRGAGDRLKRTTTNCRSRMVTVPIGILTLARAGRTFAPRMLRGGLLLLLVTIYGAYAQIATWLLSPGSGNFDTAAN
jgi:hypothetical protein